MIKCQHSILDLEVMAKIFYREILREFNILVVLNARPVDEMTPTMNYLVNNLPDIIKGKPDQLEYHVLQIQPLIAAAKLQYGNARPIILVNGLPLSAPKRQRHIHKWAMEQIKPIFNYDFNHNSFTKKNDGSLAYRHSKRLNMNTCSYCNSQFTFTIKNKRIKTRPQFDHFLDKARHPYLALSFYNLIPSCQVCNSAGVKGSSVFSIRTHLHPFLDQMDGFYRFRTDVDAVDFLVNGSDFKLILRPIPGSGNLSLAKSKRSIKDFALDDRYKFHKDIAEDILKKAYFYNNTAIEDLFKSFIVGGINVFNSESEIKELIMGNYMHPDRLHKRILSKLTKDISEEFGLTV